MSKQKWNFNIVRWREDVGWETFWLAAPVEVHIVVQARTLEDLDYELKRVLALRIFAHRELGLKGDPFDRLPPAPKNIRSRPYPQPLTLTVDWPCVWFDDGDCFSHVAPCPTCGGGPGQLVEPVCSCK